MRTTALTALFLLAGCAAHQGSVRMNLGRAFQLLPPDSAPRFGTVQQAVVIEKDGQRVFQFDAYLEAEPDRLVLLGLTPLGTRAFAVTWDGTQIESERLPFYNIPVAPEEIMACLQLALWDEKTIDGFLRGSGLRLEYQGESRRLLLGQRVFLSMTRGQPSFPHGTVVIEHHANRYTLRVQTRQFLPLP